MRELTPIDVLVWVAVLTGCSVVAWKATAGAVHRGWSASMYVPFLMLCWITLVASVLDACVSCRRDLPWLARSLPSWEWQFYSQAIGLSLAIVVLILTLLLRGAGRQAAASSCVVLAHLVSIAHVFMQIPNE